MYKFVQSLSKLQLCLKKLGQNLIQTNQSCQYKLKFGTKSNLNMKNSMVMFAFSVFILKILANLVQQN